MATQELVQVLQEMTDIHRQLLELSHSKREVLVQNQVEELNAIVNKENKLIRQLDELDKKRVFEIDRYVVGKGYRRNPSITVGDLIRITFKAEDKEALSDAHGELLQLVKQLKTANDLNQDLIKQSLGFIDFSLNMLVGEESDVTYQKPQHHQQMSKKTRFFDTRA